MPTLVEILNTYFVQPDDVNPDDKTDPRPRTFPNSVITPLIDAAAYNKAIADGLKEIESASEQFIYIANWCLGLLGGKYKPPQQITGGAGPIVTDPSPYLMDGPGTSSTLIDLIKDKGRHGADVRVLGWISYNVMGNLKNQVPFRNVAQTNVLTMKSIQELRKVERIAPTALLNVVGHAAGAVHTKLVLLGNKNMCMGFTGGIDFAPLRWAHPPHQAQEVWHDIAAKVEGLAVQALYDWFKDIWNENFKLKKKRFRFGDIEMPSHLFNDDNLKLDDRILKHQKTGTHIVQSLRTVPPAKYKLFTGADEKNPPISFAPDGLFEFRTAMKKAITNAKTYIYIEDQSFISQEVFRWIAEAIKKERKLSVILLTSGAADPTDRESPPEFLTNAINRGLFDLLTKEEQKNQVRMFKRFGDWLPHMRQIEGESPKPVVLNVTEVIVGTGTSVVKAPTSAPEGEYPLLTPVRLQIGVDTFKIVGNKGKIENGFEVFVVENLPGEIPPQPAVYEVFAKVGIIIHSKTTLVDDYWAVIGSGNIMRRSLYTDLEHGISIIDSQSVEAGKPAFVKEYRKDLWNGQFRHDNAEDFDDIQGSLYAWDSSWGTKGNAPSRPDSLEPVSLPLTPDKRLEGRNRRLYDAIQDVDARDDWTLDGVI